MYKKTILPCQSRTLLVFGQDFPCNPIPLDYIRAGRDPSKTYATIQSPQGNTNHHTGRRVLRSSGLNLSKPLCSWHHRVLISVSLCLQSISSGYPSESLAAKHRQQGNTNSNLVNQLPPQVEELLLILQFKGHRGSSCSLQKLYMRTNGGPSNKEQNKDNIVINRRC